MPDHRITPYRPDMAAASLRGVIDRPRYAEGTLLCASRGAVAMTNRPDAAAPKVSELLYGERFVAYERGAQWAWGQNQTDDYVGYVPAVGLVEDEPPATHRIRALRAFVFPEPNLKLPPLDVLGLGTRVAVGERIADYVQLTTGGWVAAVVLGAADGDTVADHAAVAERLLGVPYLWGGRSPSGLDCSGLIQLALSEARPIGAARQRPSRAGIGNAATTGVDRRGRSIRRGRNCPASRRPRVLSRACRHHGRRPASDPRQCHSHGRHLRSACRGR